MGNKKYLLVMPKYWGKQIFTHGSFAEVGQKKKTEKEKKRKKKKYSRDKFSHTGVSPKWVKSKRRREKEKERRAKVGNNNGQLRIATPPRVTHTKLPGPILCRYLS